MARKCYAYLFITGKGVAWCRLDPMLDGLFFLAIERFQEESNIKWAFEC